MSTDYYPLPPPRSGGASAVSGWLHNELIRIASALRDVSGVGVTEGWDLVNYPGSGVATINWALGVKQSIILTQSCSLAFVSPGRIAPILLRVVQDSTGGRVPTFPAGVTWLGGLPSWSTAPGSEDHVFGYFDGSGYICAAVVGVVP